MKSTNLYKYLFFFIVLFYAFVLSQFGMENYDTGYITSFSWRIINNQAIYEDFIYKGPPVTLFLHAFWMKILPETGQFFVFRIIAYFFFALQVYFSVSGFYNIYNKISINKWAVMSVCFIVSLLNSSPYPWPTKDGLLFASVAFWMISKYKNFNFFTSSATALFCLLCALTKQSFYLIPLVFLFWIFIQHGLKKALIYFIQLIAFFAVFLFLIPLKDFIDQTTGETTLHQLYVSGFSNYVFVSIRLLVPLVIIAFLIVYSYSKYATKKAISYSNCFKLFSIILFLLSIIFVLFKQIETASIIAFDACIVALLHLYFSKKNTVQHLAPIAVSLSIAWSTSISLGYPYPILHATGIILSVIVLLHYYNFEITTKHYFSITIPLSIIAFSYTLKPYNEKDIFSLSYSLDTISPKLKYIKTNKNNFEKHLELKKLIAHYGENFIVAPNFPMANYIFNHQSELPADWIIDTEVNRQFDTFIKIASDKKNYIFLEKSFIERGDLETVGEATSSSIARFIYKNFNQIDETKHFIIYNSVNR